MTGILAGSVTAVSLVIFSLSLLCFSLREFSRSRLEQICKEHDRLSRFGDILKRYDQTLLICELILLTVVLLATWLAARSQHFVSFDFPVDGTAADTVAWAIRCVAAIIVCGVAFVALPWTVARVRGEIVLFRMWPLLGLMRRLTSPIWRFAVQLDRLMHRVYGVPEPDSAEAVNLLTEELFTVVDESRREGIMQSNASTMIHRVVNLQTEDVAAIMTPRTDMVTIAADTPLNQVMPEMLASGFSRVPLVRDGIDDIVGILYARDLLTCSQAGTLDTDRQTVADISREVLYAPESQGIGDLLESMRQKKVHMAIIVDEYSGVSGLVTLEDILEEIVGEISDEYDADESELWKKHSDGCTEIDARYHLDDLNEEFGFGFPEDEEYDTIGGFALACFGRIPATGEEIFWKDLKLVVLDADDRRLIRLRIEGDESSLENSARDAAPA